MEQVRGYIYIYIRMYIQSSLFLDFFFFYFLLSFFLPFSVSRRERSTSVFLCSSAHPFVFSPSSYAMHHRHSCSHPSSPKADEERTITFLPAAPRRLEDLLLRLALGFTGCVLFAF